MMGALLYPPRQRWRVVVAFGAAALIHFAAVVLASMRQLEPAGHMPTGDEAFPPTEIVEILPAEKSTPPPDVAELPPIPNPPSESFVDERASLPSSRRQNDKRVAPIVKLRNAAVAGSLNLSSAKVLALNAPPPEYPYEARRQKITGDGIAVMTVDPLSGRVTAVSMWKSTGSAVLDNATLTGFRRWRFKPGTVSRVKSPITFTITGPQY